MVIDWQMVTALLVGVGTLFSGVAAIFALKSSNTAAANHEMAVKNNQVINKVEVNTDGRFSAMQSELNTVRTDAKEAAKAAIAAAASVALTSIHMPGAQISGVMAAAPPAVEPVIIAAGIPGQPLELTGEAKGTVVGVVKV